MWLDIVDVLEYYVLWKIFKQVGQVGLGKGVALGRSGHGLGGDLAGGWAVAGRARKSPQGGDTPKEDIDIIFHST